MCNAEFTGERPTKDKEVESEEELKKKEALLLAYDNAKALAARHKGWVYEIADWKAKNLTKKLADLLEDEEPPDPNAVKPEPAEPSAPADPNTAKAPADTPTTETPLATDPNAAQP